jgi:hypothetical protein
MDLSEIAPFGTLQQSDTFQQSVKGFASNLRRRNSFKSSFSSNKWPWMWHKNSGSGGGGGAGPAAKEPVSIPDPAPLKYSGSFLSGRKRKSRHISCPDISSASSESSRSTSPSSSSLKMSLTSLFHRSSPSASRNVASSAPVTIQRRVKSPATVDSAEEGVVGVGEFMSAIYTDDSCDHYLEEFAGLEFFPETTDSG